MLSSLVGYFGDRRTFDRRMKECEREIGAIRILLELAPAYDDATVLSARMHAATQHSGGRK